MNERDKELALQAWTENDWEGYLNIKKLIALIRADEREACALIVENEAAQYVEPVWALEIVNDIRARGNT